MYMRMRIGVVVLVLSCWPRSHRCRAVCIVSHLCFIERRAMLATVCLGRRRRRRRQPSALTFISCTYVRITDTDAGHHVYSSYSAPCGTQSVRNTFARDLLGLSTPLPAA